MSVNGTDDMTFADARDIAVDCLAKAERAEECALLFEQSSDDYSKLFAPKKLGRLIKIKQARQKLESIVFKEVQH